MRGIEQIPWAYDALLWLYEKAGLSRWRSWLVRGARGRVLDLGCGTGRNLPLYDRSAAPALIGFDPSLDSLRKARRRAPGVPLVQARAEALPFKSGAFDTVVSGLVFCSVDDVPRGLAEVERTLAAGGRLRMLEHVRSPGLGGRLQDLLQPAWTCLAGGCRPNRDTEAAVARAGFAIDPASRRAQGTMRRFEARPPDAARKGEGG
jgi:SAM-dependent methyltransferase